MFHLAGRARLPSTAPHERIPVSPPENAPERPPRLGRQFYALLLFQPTRLNGFRVVGSMRTMWSDERRMISFTMPETPFGPNPMATNCGLTRTDSGWSTYTIRPSEV